MNIKKRNNYQNLYDNINLIINKFRYLNCITLLSFEIFF